MRTHVRLRALLAAGMILCLGGAAEAVTIVPAGATGTNPTHGSPAQVINGDGLIGAGPILTRTHQTTHLKGWLKDNTNSGNQLVFQMPGPRDLTGLHAWQYSQGTCCTGRGVSTFNASFSFDGGGTYPITIGLGPLAMASGTSDEAVQTITFPQQNGVTHVKFDTIADFPAGSNPGWQGLNEVRFEAVAQPNLLTGTPIGNALTSRSAATDTATNVLYSNFVPMPAAGVVAGVHAYFQRSAATATGGSTFRMYQLRPLASNQYQVVYDSGTISTGGVEGAVEGYVFPNGPTAVQAGDIFAHYGRGLPWSVSGGANAKHTQFIYFPSPSPPAQGNNITLDSAAFPQSSHSRDYAWAVDYTGGVSLTDLTPDTVLPNTNYNRVLIDDTPPPNGFTNAGRHVYDDGAANHQYMWFDYSGKLGTLPAGESLVSATLIWSGVSNGGFAINDAQSMVGVFAVPDANKGMDAIFGAHIPGSDTQAFYAANTPIDALNIVTEIFNDGVATWDVTALLQQWLASPSDPLNGQFVLVNGAGRASISSGGYPRLLVVTRQGAVIPEPITMLAVGLAVTGLGRYVRKRS